VYWLLLHVFICISVYYTYLYVLYVLCTYCVRIVARIHTNCKKTKSLVQLWGSNQTPQHAEIVLPHYTNASPDNNVIYGVYKPVNLKCNNTYIYIHIILTSNFMELAIPWNGKYMCGMYSVYTNTYISKLIRMYTYVYVIICLNSNSIYNYTYAYVSIRTDLNRISKLGFQIRSCMYYACIARTCLNFVQIFVQNTYKYMQIRPIYVQIRSQNQYVHPNFVGSNRYTY